MEDDIEYVEILKNYLIQFEKEYGEKIIFRHFEDGADIAENYKGEYDIILMDIEMTFLDGMSAAQEIRKSDDEVVIIFITNMPQYVMEGYKVNALDYVLKPISYYALSQRLTRAIGRMRRRKKKYVLVPMRGGTKKIDASHIYYVEVRNHMLTFYTKEGMIQGQGSIRELEEGLMEEGFYRCNKCYLINLEYVDSIHNNDVVINGEIVQVSRSKKKDLMNQLNNYINEVSL